MKKLLFIAFMFLSLLSMAQQPHPNDQYFKFVTSPGFYYYSPDSSLWVYKGVKNGGWMHINDYSRSVQYNDSTNIFVTPSQLMDSLQNTKLDAWYAGNGLTKICDNVVLGGMLEQNTLIDVKDYPLVLSRDTGQSNADNVLSIINKTSSNNAALDVEAIWNGFHAKSTGGVAIFAESENYYSITAQSNNSNAILATSVNGVPILAQTFKEGDDVPSIKPMLELRTSVQNNSFIPEVGQGQSIDFNIVRGLTNNELTNRLISQWKTYDESNKISEFSIKGYNNTSTDLLKIDGTGLITIPQGTPNKYLYLNASNEITYADGGGGGGGGTVTSVDSGLGLTGGAITTTGTLSVDTASTVILSRQRADNTYQRKMVTVNDTIQALSGTTVAWNLARGRNATITLTGNTTITLSNATPALVGNLTVTNPATAYVITFAGYTNKIHNTIWVNTNQVQATGGSTIDMFSYYYSPSTMIWNGGNDYK